MDYEISDTYRKYTPPSKVAEMTHEQLAALCRTMRQTFQALQLCTPPDLSAFLRSPNVTNAVDEAIRKYMIADIPDLYEQCWSSILRKIAYVADGDQYYGNTSKMLSEYKKQDLVLEYMFDNISCGDPLVVDIHRV